MEDPQISMDYRLIIHGCLWVNSSWIIHGCLWTLLIVICLTLFDMCLSLVAMFWHVLSFWWHFVWHVFEHLLQCCQHCVGHWVSMLWHLLIVGRPWDHLWGKSKGSLLEPGAIKMSLGHLFSTEYSGTPTCHKGGGNRAECRMTCASPFKNDSVNNSLRGSPSSWLGLPGEKKVVDFNSLELTGVPPSPHISACLFEPAEVY